MHAQVKNTNVSRSMNKNVNKVKAKAQAVVIDPEVEIISAMIQRSGLTDEQIAARVSAVRKSKMSPLTVRAIRELSCKRPHNYTLKWIGFALGMRRVWVSIH